MATGTTTDIGYWKGLWQALTGQPRIDKGTESYPFNTASTPGGTVISTNTSLRLSAVWACIRLRSQTMASLPLSLRDRNKNVVYDHPLYRILHDSPNADMCAAEFWEAMFASMDISGNAYAEIKRNKSGEVISLEYLNPEYMSIKRANNGNISYIYRGDTINEKNYDESYIFHIRGFTLDGLEGLSPIKYAAETLGSQLEANNAATVEYKNRLKTGGVLKYDKGVLNDDHRKKLHEMLADYSNPENAGKYLILEAGLSVDNSQGLKISPADAQLLESRHFGIEEICRIFGVPPQLIGQTDKASSWASSLDSTNMGFLTYTLRPILVKIEQTIARKLLSPADRLIYRPKFNVDGLMRTDPQARASYYSQMVQNGIYSRNQARELEDLPPVEGGDELTIQLNMTTLSQIGKEKVEKE